MSKDPRAKKPPRQRHATDCGIGYGSECQCCVENGQLRCRPSGHVPGETVTAAALANLRREIRAARGVLSGIGCEGESLKAQALAAAAEIRRLRGMPRTDPLDDPLPDDPETLKEIIRNLDVEIIGAMDDLRAEQEKR